MRIDYTKPFPSGFEAMLGLERAVRRSDLDPLLLELMKLRASQLEPAGGRSRGAAPIRIVQAPRLVLRFLPGR